MLVEEKDAESPMRERILKGEIVVGVSLPFIEARDEPVLGVNEDQLVEQDFVGKFFAESLHLLSMLISFIVIKKLSIVKEIGLYRLLFLKKDNQRIKGLKRRSRINTNVHLRLV